MDILDYDHAKFVGRDKEIKLILDKAQDIYSGNALANEKQVVHFIDHSNIGKTWLLRELEYQFISGQSHCEPLLWQLTGSKRFNKDEFVMDLVNCFADKLELNLIGKSAPNELISKKMWQISNHKVVVIMIDDIDQFKLKQIEELEGLLTGLISCEKMIIVFAGRKTVSHWAKFELRPDSANTFSLSPFKREDTAKQLASEFPIPLPIEIIHRVSGGNPGYNYLIAKDFISGANNQFDELKAVNICTKNLRKSIPGDLYQALTALSVLESFNDVDEMAPILQTYNRSIFWTTTKCSELLKKILQPFKNVGKLVLWDGNDYIIDPEICRLLERELELTNKQMWQDLHCTAYGMYKSWADDTKSQRYDDAQKYHTKRLSEGGISLKACNTAALEERIQ